MYMYTRDASLVLIAAAGIEAVSVCVFTLAYIATVSKYRLQNIFFGGVMRLETEEGV